ncbi:RagB/SusD family nutrient uptake outer membrane protein [uncultured Draconibacterium sp.]|uniref:RagB/SusD family nutrient uptake outer membrane protein n=1 Tax=uncultured Draconibacterium sp. TaxID=1573823 RepID=UPI003260F496
MKNKITYLILSLFILTTSCELEELVVDRFTPETFYKTEADAHAAINGAYSELTSFAYYKYSYSAPILLSSDAIFSTKNDEYSQYSKKTYSSSSNYLRNSWNSIYHVVNNSNLVLEYVPQMEINEAVKNRITGEAYFLRALSYLNLVRSYGGVPLKLKATLDDSDLHTPRASKEEVYQQIFEDLKMAIQLMPVASEQPTAEYGRATKGSAQALLALAYLTHGDWTEAKEYADQVINSGEYSLVADFGDLWDVNKEKQNGQEVIFAVKFARDGLESLARSIGSEFALRMLPNSARGLTGHPKGAGTSHLQIQPYFYDIYTTGQYEGDYRAEKTFFTEWTGDNGKIFTSYPNPSAGGIHKKGAYIGKYIDPDGYDTRNHENDLNIIRYAEVLLIKAEAANELGLTAEAYDAFNQVRKRARNADGITRTTPADLTPGLSKDEFRDAVFNERGAELIGEGQRWFDLLRMKRANGTTYYEYMFNEFVPSLPADKFEQSSIVWNPKNLLFPIPVGEIVNNTAINPEDQNPGF